MAIDWSTVSRDEANNQLNLLRNGMATTLADMYVLPAQARLVHENFVRRMRERGSGPLFWCREKTAQARLST